MKEIQIPQQVGWILAELEKNGYEAYAVGGCVRDSLLGREPKDWDVTTSARPQDVKRIFRNTYDTGIEHGTVSVRVGTEIYEVTTFRVDGDYLDHRRPDSVEYTDKLAEDLKRRDFTMNAMAYHPRTGLIDLFGGQEDLRIGCIRCVGDPEERFEEDALRMLRAFRFAARFGFRVEEKTEKAVRIKASLLENVSRERVREEMDQLICSVHSGILRDICATGLMAYIIPEWMPCIGVAQNTPYHAYTVEEHMIRAVEAAQPVRVVRWAALLHDIAKPYCRNTDVKGRDHFPGHPGQSAQMADKILRRLKFDNATREAIVLSIRLHDETPPQDLCQMRHLMSRIPDGFYPYLQALQRADAAAQNPRYLEASIKRLDAAKGLYEHVVEEKQCVKLADLAINGRDLIDLGFPKGRMIGEVLQQLLHQVLDYPNMNQKAFLLDIANRLKERMLP
ncbi:MAG: HDIG domain-containing metalloprotein [Lachnospirales bacterium]